MDQKFRLYTDGSYSKTENIAGFGGYIENSNGQCILKFSETIEDSKNFNNHELLGLKKGMQLALDNNITNIVCYTDDKNMAQIFNTNNADTTAIYCNTPLRKSVWQLKEQFKSFEIYYIPRKKNVKADRLSRQTIHKLINEKKDDFLSKKEYFINSKLIISSQKMSESKKNEIILIQKTMSHCIVFTRTQKDMIDVYLTTKKDGFITHHLIDQVPFNEKQSNSKTLIDCMTKVLDNQKHLKRCAISFVKMGNCSQHIQDLLRGYNYIIPSLEKSVNNLNNALSNFEQVVYTDNELINKTIESHIIDKNPNKALQLDKENIIDALSQLEQNDYFLGKNPSIEYSGKIKDTLDEKQNILELQKYYFGCFIRLLMKDTSNLHYKISFKDKENLIKEKIQAAQNELQSHGIKFTGKASI